MRAKTLPVTSIILFAVTLLLPADIVHVPVDQPTIQNGIFVAFPGDTVLVADGTYTGPGNVNLDLLGQAITVRSANGPENCIIHCGGDDLGFILDSNEGADSVIRGFTITGGAGGIFCFEASPTIIGCVITDHDCYRDGGGIACYYSSAGIYNNTIAGNRATYDAYDYGPHFGGGIGCWSGSPLIVNNVIRSNRTESQDYDDCGGGIYLYDVTAHLENNLIIGNQAQWGDGIYAENSDLTVVNCTLFNDDSSNLSLVGESSMTMINSISRDVPPWTQPTCVISYSDIWRDAAPVPGEGNIDADPLFTGTAPDYARLSQRAAGQAEDSPCVDAGSAPAGNLGFTTPDGEVHYSDLSTRTDGFPDFGAIDMGYHGPAADAYDTISVSINCAPGSGTLPFTTSMGLVLANQYEGQRRRIAGHLDLTLGNGGFIPSWRAGFTNVGPGTSLVHLVSLNIPAIPAMIGSNQFRIVGEDVTPAPYNHPPYPPAGDTGSDTCTVVGLAPLP